MRAYQRPGMILQRGATLPREAVVDLQRDLRALGYLSQGIDGDFGASTEAAIKALQYDLLHNDGRSAHGDGDAPVAIKSFNGSTGSPIVSQVNGVVNESLASCIVTLTADVRIPQLPSAADPKAENAKALATIASSTSTVAPVPFISAIVRQESGGRHFCVPGGDNTDNFIVLGADRNAADKDCISSRGYGIGQYTLFHHPPRADEVRDCMQDPVRNVQKAQTELRAKFDQFIAGPADHADERQVEHPSQPLRLCKYAPNDAHYLRDCRACAHAVPTKHITVGTPFYAGSTGTYQPTQYYTNVNYPNVPDRAAFPCDWPYAVRRYNGSGVNSYHYQSRILTILAGLPDL